MFDTAVLMHSSEEWKYASGPVEAVQAITKAI